MDEPFVAEFIRKLKPIKPASGLILHLDLAENVFIDEKTVEYLNKWLKDNGYGDTPLLQTYGGSDIKSLDDEAMNKLGWYRQPPCEKCGKHPAPIMRIVTEENGETKASYYCAQDGRRPF